MQNTPQQHFETSPTQRLVRTKTDLPTCEKLLRPQVVENFSKTDAQRKAKQRHFYNRGEKDLLPLDEETRVWVQPTKLGDYEWRPATVLHQVSTRCYEVETEGARTYIRNQQHLKETPPVRDTRSQDQQDVLLESQCNVSSKEQWSSAGQGTADPIPSPLPAASIPSVTVPPEAGVEGMPRTTRSGREVRTPAYLRDFKLDKPFWTLN